MENREFLPINALLIENGYGVVAYSQTQNPKEELMFDDGTRGVYLGYEVIQTDGNRQNDRYLIYDPLRVEVITIDVTLMNDDDIDDAQRELINEGYNLADLTVDKIVGYKDKQKELIKTVV